MKLPKENNPFFIRQCGLTPDGVDPMDSPALALCAAREVAAGGAKNATFEPFYTKHCHFTKTGSGQTQGKLRKKRRFVQSAAKEC
jgi:hypothetical protein